MWEKTADVHLAKFPISRLSVHTKSHPIIPRDVNHELVPLIKVFGNGKETMCLHPFLRIFTLCNNNNASPKSHACAPRTPSSNRLNLKISPRTALCCNRFNGTLLNHTTLIIIPLLSCMFDCRKKPRKQPLHTLKKQIFVLMMHKRQNLQENA